MSFPATTPSPNPAMDKPLSDAERIQAGIIASQVEGRPIDVWTARRIAAQLHTGQFSAYYALASAHHFQPEPLMQDIWNDIQSTHLDPDADGWLAPLLIWAFSKSLPKIIES